MKTAASELKVNDEECDLVDNPEDKNIAGITCDGLGHSKSPQLQEWLSQKDTTAGMPVVILMEVIDQIAAGLGHILLEALQVHREDSLRDVPWDCRLALAAMGLVHRSWTVPSQTALHRRIITSASRMVQSLAENPYCGAAVQELILQISDIDEIYGFRVLWQTRNLRFLDISYHVRPSSQDDGELFLSIGRLVQLQGLIISCHASTGRSAAFIQLCEALPTLCRLSFLYLDGFDCDSELSREPLSDKLVFCTPPSTLQSIFINIEEHIPYYHLSWLLRPSHGYALRSLYLITYGQATIWHSPPEFGLQAALRSLRNLCISSPEESGSGTFPPSRILDNCQDLKYLYLSHYGDAGDIFLPASLEELYLYAYEATDNEEAANQFLLSILTTQRLPLLRRLVFLPRNTAWTDEDRAKESIDLKKHLHGIAEYCRKAGISFCFASFWDVNPITEGDDFDDFRLRFITENSKAVQ